MRERERKEKGEEKGVVGQRMCRSNVTVPRCVHGLRIAAVGIDKVQTGLEMRIRVNKVKINLLK